MNYSMVRRLILKDWYLNRWMTIAAIPAGLASLALILTGSKAAFILSIILVVTVVIGFGAQLAVATVINERKEQTLPFVMSLPISYREYTAAKILGNLIIFLVPWLALVGGSFALILFTPGMPRGLLSFAAIMGVEFLVSTCIVMATAVMTESQGWTIAAIMVGNVALNAFGYYFGHIPSIAAVMWGPAVHWPTAATGVLLAELGAIGMVLAITFYVQSRKRDFI